MAVVKLTPVRDVIAEGEGKSTATDIIFSLCNYYLGSRPGTYQFFSYRDRDEHNYSLLSAGRRI